MNAFPFISLFLLFFHVLDVHWFKVQEVWVAASTCSTLTDRI